MEPTRPSCCLWKGLIVVIGMACGICPTASQVSIDACCLQYIEGEEALLILNNVPANPTEVSWHRGSQSTEETLIMRYFPVNKTWQEGPLFSHRENVTKEYLYISGTKLSDTGNYTAKVAHESKVQTATALLRIGEFYTKPVLTLNTSSAVEYLDVVAASCSTNATKIIWNLYDTQVASGDRMTLSPDNKTLIIHRVSRSDTFIECKITNSAGMSQSSSARLTVSYGPDSVTLRSSPLSLDGVLRADLGSRVEMNCSVYNYGPSTTTAKYRWTHYNTLLNSEKSITIQNLTKEQLGRYRCTVENPVTQIIVYRDMWVQKPLYIPDPSKGFLLDKPLMVFLIVLAVLGGISLCGMLIYALLGHCSNRMKRATPVSTSEQ